MTFQTYFLSLLVKEKMNKILHIILISIFSLTIISCGEKEEHTNTNDNTNSTTTDTTAPVIVEVT